MFANRDVMEEREIAAAEAWAKAKTKLRIFRAVIFLALFCLPLLCFYYLGQVNAWADCKAIRPARVSTPR